MTEINHNINGYGYPIERMNIKKESGDVQKAAVQKETTEANYVADTCVLGRSQIDIKGGNIDKSVNEAVKMAKEQPVRLGCSEEIFDTMYNSYLKQGFNESDSYMKALADEEEFLDISQSFKR